MASAGGVHTEFTASTAQVREEMERGKKAAARFASGVKRSMSSVRGSNASAGKAFGGTADKAKKATSAIQGLSAGVSASAGALRLSGNAAASSLGEMANNVVSLGSGLGPLAAGLVAVTATILAFKGALDLAAASSKKSIEFSSRLLAMSDAQKALYKDSAKAATESEAATRGLTVAELQQAEAIEETRRQLRLAQNERDRLQSKVLGQSALATIVGGDQGALDRAEAAVSTLFSRLQNLQRARTQIEERESDKRIALAEAERDKVTAAAAEQARSLIEAARKANNDRISAFRANATSTIAQLRVLNARVDAVDKEGAEKAIALLRVEERNAVEAAEREGRDVSAVRAIYAARRRLAEAEEAKRRRDAAAEAAREEVEAAESARAQAQEAAHARAVAMARMAADFRAARAAEEAQRRADGDFGGGLEEGIVDARAGLENLRALGSSVGRNLADSFGNAFASFAVGATSAKEAFRVFARSVVIDTVAMIAKYAVLAGLSSVVTGGTTAATGTASFAQSVAAINALSLSIAGVPGFARGGSFMVGGSGGTDSQMVAFRATPNERVTVETPAQQAAGGAVRVVINNNGPPLRASASSQLGADGVREIVISTVVDDIARNGPMGKALEGHVRRLRGGRNT